MPFRLYIWIVVRVFDPQASSFQSNFGVFVATALFATIAPLLLTDGVSPGEIPYSATTSFPALELNSKFHLNSVPSSG